MERKKFIITNVIIYLAAAVCVYAWHILCWKKTGLFFKESISIFVFMLVVLVCIKPLYELICSMPKKLRVGFYMFMFLFYGAQLIGHDRMVFPLARWHMFSNTVYRSDVVYFKYLGLTKQGERVIIRPPAAFKSLASSRIVTDTDSLVRSVITFDQDKYEYFLKEDLNRSTLGGDIPSGVKGAVKKIAAKVRSYGVNVVKHRTKSLEQRKKLLGLSLNAIGQRYNKMNPNQEIVSIEVIKCFVDITEEQYKVQTELIWQTPIES